jgi:hypothetical protein
LLQGRLVKTIVTILLSTLSLIPALARADDPGSHYCLTRSTAALQVRATAAPGAPVTGPAEVAAGESVTLTWQINPGCTGMRLLITGEHFSPDALEVSATGTRTVVPSGSGTWRVVLMHVNSARELASAEVVVTQPVVAGRVQVTVTHNYQKWLLLQAAAIPNAIVRIVGDVNLDLSNERIIVAPGVQLIGDQSVHPRGPRLYTRSFPSSFIHLNHADGVRITGLRIDGGQTDSADSAAEASRGIMVSSSLDVEIDNNEIFGWRGSGVDVADRSNRSDFANATRVRIHDNFIHHNQHDGRQGYGVVVEEGAFAAIERNVFDWNRHAIAGDGKDGTGMLIAFNLVLGEGGRNTWYNHTHQIDMHGQDDCWGIDAWCGVAGEYFDFRYNTVLYKKGVGVRVRGWPVRGADVAHNVFAAKPGVDPPAADQTDGLNLDTWNNTVDYNAFEEPAKYCDFDHDGLADRFVATGVTWWFLSSKQSRWRYLSSSTRRMNTLTLGDVTGDGRCDVSTAGTVYPDGLMPRRTDLLWERSDLSGFVISELGNDGFVRASHAPPLANRTTLATGDFDGDGDTDVLLQAGAVAWLGYLNENQLLPTGQYGPDQYIGAVPTQPVVGVGDFDGDGTDDVLWDGGTIWFSGRGERSASFLTTAPPEFGIVNWSMKAVGDFTGSGRAEVLVRHLTTGEWRVVRLRGTQWVDSRPFSAPSGTWKLETVADFDGDGAEEPLWRSPSTHQLLISLPSGHQALPWAVPPEWRIMGGADANGDGRADLFWHHDQGELFIWMLDGAHFIGSSGVGVTASPIWWKLGRLLPRRVRGAPFTAGNAGLLVPNVVGLSLQEAALELSRVGLNVGEIYERVDCNNIGAVTSQQPGAGLVQPGSSVRLYLGTRPAPPRVCQ